MTTHERLFTADVQTPQQVLDAWFKDEETGRMDLPQSKRWFLGGEALDSSLQTQFSSTIEAASARELEHWKEEPESALALIVLLDQFNRNIHRGTASAFSLDDQALATCHHSIDNHFASQLPLTQQVFVYMPLEHDESLASQEKSVALFQQLVAMAPVSLEKFAQGILDYALQHQAIIQQFGRYPYRNEVIGRASTPEEIHWLAEKNTRFGQ